MNEKRVILSNVHIVENIDNEVEVEVSLSYGEFIQSNKIVSSNEQHHRLRAVAHATEAKFNVAKAMLNATNRKLTKYI